ncbi:MAG: HAD-IIIA family hydrolase [bacterium]
MNKALFLDRDGTIIFDKNYLADPNQVELIPGAAEALRIAMKLGYLMFLFTNQSGIGRKYFSMEDVLRVNTRMTELIGLDRPVFTGTCIAPETSAETPMSRKPSPKFILEMVR